MSNARLVYIIVSTDDGMPEDFKESIENAISQMTQKLTDHFHSSLEIDLLDISSGEMERLSDNWTLLEQDRDVPNTGCVFILINGSKFTNTSRNNLTDFLAETKSTFPDMYGIGITIDSYSDKDFPLPIPSVQVESPDELHYAICRLSRLSAYTVFAGNGTDTYIDGRMLRDWYMHSDDRRYCDVMDSFIEYYFDTKKATLYLRGNGIIQDFSFYDEETPWSKYKDFVQRVRIFEGVKVIGVGAFHDFPLLERVEIASSVSDIRAGSFENCPNLVDVRFQRDSVFWAETFLDTSDAPDGATVIWSDAFTGTPWGRNHLSVVS